MPAKLASEISGHEVIRAVQVGLEGVSNGRLLEGAEKLGFQVVVTIDKGILFQQPMGKRMIAAIVLDRPNSKLEFLIPLVPKLLKMLPELQPGDLRTISEP